MSHTQSSFDLDIGLGLLDDSSLARGGDKLPSDGDYSTFAQATGTSASSGFVLNDFFDSSTTTASGQASSKGTWQKSLLSQQQQLERNSLNAFLNQNSNQPHNSILKRTDGAGATPPFAPSAPQVQADQHTYLQLQQLARSQPTASGQYMFFATIVDPNQEDASPQQMLFLPESNHVVSMFSSCPTACKLTGNDDDSTSTSTSAKSPMMASLANLPVVFPKSNGNASGQNSLKGSSAAEFYSQKQTLHGTKKWVRSSESIIGSNQFHNRHAGKNEHPALRPLSAYNFFFSDERERILQNKTGEDADNELYDSAKKERLLLQHLAKDRTKRRPHRKTHGKINFTTLSKLIGQRWKALSDEQKNFYREVAAIDLERYQSELREHTAAKTGVNST